MRRVAAFGVIALVVGGCGASSHAIGPPPPVPVNAVPVALSTGPGLTVTPNTTKQVTKAFAAVGKTSLAHDGKVWELRAGSQLVGVLQLTSLNERVDTTKAADRDAVLRQILAGSQSEFDVATTPVWTANDSGRGTYVWFGRQVFGVLQVKSSQFELDAAATEMVTDLLESKAWPALPPEAFQEDL